MPYPLRFRLADRAASTVPYSQKAYPLGRPKGKNDNLHTHGFEDKKIPISYRSLCQTSYEN